MPAAAQVMPDLSVVPESWQVISEYTYTKKAIGQIYRNFLGLESGFGRTHLDLAQKLCQTDGKA